MKMIKAKTLSPNKITKIMSDLGYIKKGNAYHKLDCIHYLPILKAHNFTSDQHLASFILQSEMPKFKIEVERNQAFYVAPELQNVATPTIYRVDFKGERYYYEKIIVNKMIDVILYASGTTLIKEGMAMGFDSLNKAKIEAAKNGNDLDEYARYRATFGTIMHALYAYVLIGTPIVCSPGAVKEFVLKYINSDLIDQDHLEKIFRNDIDELSISLLCIAKAVQDYNIKPLFIEKILRSRKYGVATAIDLLCEMDYFVEVQNEPEYYKIGEKKGQQKPITKSKKRVRINAIWDFKSGKNFYDPHVLQLDLNEKIVKENYPNIEIGGIFNFSPQGLNSMGVPEYKLKEQSQRFKKSITIHRLQQKAELIYAQGKLNHSFKNPMISGFNNLVIDINKKETDYSKAYIKIPLRQYLSEIE